jgi:hypothetical protein
MPASDLERSPDRWALVRDQVPQPPAPAGRRQRIDQAAAAEGVSRSELGLSSS